VCKAVIDKITRDLVKLKWDERVKAEFITWLTVM
jgi:hypothetical protein